MRQAGSSKTVDPNTLAKSLSKIRVQENGRESASQFSTKDDAVRMRKIEESLRGQRFDVFLSFAEEDQDFAEEVRHRIVSKLKLRVFVPSDGESLSLSLSLSHSPSPSLSVCLPLFSHLLHPSLSLSLFPIPSPVHTLFGINVLHYLQI